MAVPATVIYFTCYDQLCAALKVRLGDHADKAPLFAGAIARGNLHETSSPGHSKANSYFASNYHT